MRYFFVFTPDRGGREDCSVYYTDLIIAKDESEAKDKFIEHTLKLHIKNREKSFKRLLTKDEIAHIKSGLTFTDGSDEYSGEFEILEVTPIQ
jgi:hypothetical protein